MREIGCPWLRIIELLSLQNAQNYQKIEKSRRKTEQTREGQLARSCQPPRAVPNMGQPWRWLSGHLLWFLLFSCFLIFFPATCCTVFTRGIWHILTMLGIFGLRLQTLLIHQPQKHLLITCMGLAKSKYTKTLKTSKTTHNRRNRGINRLLLFLIP